MSASAADGWQPLSGPVRRRLGVDWDAAFPRLAVCHMLSVAGETLVVLSLAGSFFFKVDPSQGREKVILGLLFTMAPFALVGPLIGPLIDRVRGGHRAVIQGTMAMRVVVAVAMMIAVVNDSIALFPEAFAMLVLAKTYQIAKAAVVPTTVAGDLELVEANSKLQLLSGLAAMVAGAVGGVALQIGPDWVLGLTTVVFATASVAAFRLHPSLRGDAEERLAVDEPRRGAADPLPHDLAVAAFSMGSLRFVVGFLTFLLAFELRGGDEATPLARAVHYTLLAYRQIKLDTVVPPLEGAPPSWYFGVVIVASVLGGLVGALVAPVARRRFAEEHILVGAAGLAVATGVGGLLAEGLLSYATLGFGVATAAALGKQAFDAVVQRDVDETDRGRVFARFEARFQMAWVVGALVPSVLHVPVGVGAVAIAVSASGATLAMVGRVRPVIVHRGRDGKLARPYISRNPSSRPGRSEGTGQPEGFGQSGRSGKSGMSGSSSSSGSG